MAQFLKFAKDRAPGWDAMKQGKNGKQPHSGDELMQDARRYGVEFEDEEEDGEIHRCPECNYLLPFHDPKCKMRIMAEVAA